MNILVIGEICRDIFKYCDCKRICPEAPVPVLNPVEETENKGMAGNVLGNIISLANKLFDSKGTITLITNIEEIKKIRLIDKKSNQMIARIDEGDSVSNSFDLAKIDFSLYDCVVVSDYDKGFLTAENLIAISQSHGTTFLDTKKILGNWAKRFTFVKINEPEYLHSKKYFNEVIGLNNLIVTLSEKGAMYQGEIFPTGASEVKDVSGAGDTFLAALVVQYMRERDIKSSIRFANECANKVIQRKGVVTI